MSNNSKQVLQGITSSTKERHNYSRSINASPLLNTPLNNSTLVKSEFAQNIISQNLYNSAKEKLRNRLFESGIASGMPSVSKPERSAPGGALLPSRVIQGREFNQNRAAANESFIGRSASSQNRSNNLNNISVLMDLSSRGGKSDVVPKKPSKLPPLEARGRSNSPLRPVRNAGDSSIIQHSQTATQTRRNPNNNESFYNDTSPMMQEHTPVVHQPRYGSAMRSHIPTNRNSNNVSFNRSMMREHADFARANTIANSVMVNSTMIGAQAPSFNESFSVNLMEKLTGRNLPPARTYGEQNLPKFRRNHSMRSRSMTQHSLMESLQLDDDEDEENESGNKKGSRPGSRNSNLQSLLDEDDDNELDATINRKEGASPTRRVRVSADDDGNDASKTHNEVYKLKDIDSFIYLIKEGKIHQSEFTYLIKGPSGDPYNLKVAEYHEIKDRKYYTLSAKGVCRFENNIAQEFVGLKEWLQERDKFNYVKKLSFFKRFRKWKTLKKWNRILQRRKRAEIMSALKDKLFIANPIMQRIILQHKQQCMEIQELRIVDVGTQIEVQPLEIFASNQESKRASVVEELQNYSARLHENSRVGIKRILERLRDQILSEMSNDEEERKQEDKEALLSQSDKQKKGNSRNVFEALGFPEFLNYGHRSMLRYVCTRFLRLAYLLDFMVVESLGIMYLESARELLNRMAGLYDAHVEGPKLGKEQTRQRADPLFLINVELEPDEINARDIHYIEVETKVNKIDDERELEDPMDLDLNVYTQFDAPFDWDDQQRKLEEEARLAKKSPKKANKKTEREEEEERRKRTLKLQEAPEIDESSKKRHCSEIHHLWLNLNPDKNDFNNLIDNFFTEGVECIQVIERWSKHKEFLPYANALEEWDEIIGDKWIMPEQIHLNPMPYLRENPFYRTFLQTMNTLLTNSFTRIDVFFREFRLYLNYYWTDLTTNFALLEDDNMKYQNKVYQSMLDLYRNEQVIFEEELIQYGDIGLFRLNVDSIRRTLQPFPTKNLKRLETMLPDILRRRVKSAVAWLNESKMKLSGICTHIEEFIALKKSLLRIMGQYNYQKKLFNNINGMFHLLNENSFTLQSDIRDNIANMNTLINELTAQIEQAEYNTTKNTDRFIKTLTEKIINLRADAIDALNLASQKKYIENSPLPVAIIDELNALDKKVAEIEGRTDKFKGYEEILQVQEYADYSSVEELRNELNLRITLWKSREEWKSISEEWLSIPFRNINAKEISHKAEQYAKIIYRCEKNLPDNPVVHDLKKAVYTFRDSMPIVTALRSQYLGEEHWEEIKQLVKVDFDIKNDEFTMQSLVDNNFAKYQEEIIGIQTQAAQEHFLDQQLIAVENVWRQHNLVIKSYKEARESYILVELDDIFMALDESLATMNNILASRYVKKLRPKAEGVKNTLLSLSDILDRWLECQKKWMYLENIFTAQDIKKQLEKEAAMFDQCDKTLRNLLKRVQMQPNAYRVVKMNNIFENLTKTNENLDYIEKELEEYLEVKRGFFPRFYFLSNDELIEILANSQDIEAVQKHLRKCFENIIKLSLKSDGKMHSILGMISGEGELIKFRTSLQVRGNVEVWLDLLQKAMIEALKNEIKQGLVNFVSSVYKTRNEWVLNHYGQVVSTVSQITWCASVEEAILDNESNSGAIAQCYDLNLDQLTKLTDLVRGNITSLQRKVVVALITQDVHARDIVEKLMNENVENLNTFVWVQQLRYYWEEKQETCMVQQVTASLQYGYEYLGATSRLVITPLTDRCWITITAALHLKLGAAPAGPAGTGKTESTKDLAKGLGTLCIVFNCSDQVTTAMMSKLFAGLAQQGAWTCLDEFNRIDIEVLSVIAQQLLTIRLALLTEESQFNFEGRDMPLKPNGVFITMNPGYAGRTELPDNLKVLFRPVSMMIPDYGLIAEIMLFAEGFQNAKPLSKKMVQLYKLSSEQLSQQDHYDFGMRAVKSVLVMAGSLKRQETKLEEDVVLIRAMRDSNVPKFLKDDLPLFQALIQDLFPGVHIPDKNYGELMKQIKLSLAALGLQEHDEFELKVTQLFETFNVRFGVMLVGPTGAGKSKCFRVLQHAMTTLHIAGSTDTRFQKVKTQIINPKSIKMGELYGEVNPFTQEWQDGLASSIIRNANNQDEDPNQREWVVFDGPVDALWIENMNTVLDDNMTLCLANSERIKLRNELRMLFEVQDLAVASPATVSRCGMVYMSSDSLGWVPYVKSWIERTYPDNTVIPDQKYKEMIYNLFLNTVDVAIAKMRTWCTEPIPTVTIQKARNVCNFIELLLNKNTFSHIDDPDETKRRVNYLFCYSFIWGLGASIDERSYDRYDHIVKDIFKSMVFPRSETIFDFYLDEQNEYTFVHWDNQVPEFEYDKELPYFQLLVPTVDTVKYSSILELLVMNQKPTFLTGVTGVGKSVVIQNKLFDLKEHKNASPISLTFSAQTESLETQVTIENKLSKKSKYVYGARPGQKMIIFIDDINMPALEQYGAQPCIELLRQLLDLGGFYDRQKLFWKGIEDSVLLCASAPPGGGRNIISPRFIRHFNVICASRQSDKTMSFIFGRILEGFFQAWGFSDNVKRLSEYIVQGTVEIYTRISSDLLPTPTKFHYIFNLRDVSKVFQGFLMVKPQSCNQPEDVARLWAHENARVFGDRLINTQDREWFMNLLVEISNRFFRLGWTYENTFVKSKIIFGDLLKLEAPQKLYEEIKDKPKLIKVLQDKQEEHNMSSTQIKLTLVFFEDAVDHILRISRILRQPRGNAMLIGVGGSGKQSLARLSSFILGNEVFQIELAKNYNADSFKADLMKLMMKTGVERTSITFIFTDSQVAQEVFLEYINNMLNSGEVPNLFAKKEDFDEVINGARAYNKELKRPDSPEVIYNTFLESVRDKLHIVLCMSPVGENLRIWCRKFPSLINCCTLDWFSEWPREALVSVSYSKLSEVQMPNDNIRLSLAEACMQISKDVEGNSDLFFNELKRKVYNTPKSYLDQISLYIEMLSQKRMEINSIRNKLREGMEKLQNTNQIVASLKVQLTELQPQLEVQQEKTDVFLKQLEIDTALANEKETLVKSETTIVQKQTAEVEAVAKEAEADVAKALPALKEAEEALGKLQKSEITEIKSFANPPDAVRMVMEAVCILFGEKPDWPTAKVVLMDVDFLGKMNRYDKTNVPEKLLTRIRTNYTSKAEFDPESVGQKSAACKGICLWVRAVDNFARVNKEVEPKRKKMLKLQEKMNASKMQLAEKSAQLEEVQDKVARLKEECDETVAKKEELANEKDLTEKRLMRAEKLTGLLADEGIRWKEILTRLNVEVEQLVGNTFIAASTISYLGPFTGSYRKKMIDEWISFITEKEIPFSENYTLANIAGDALLIREWCINGLPTDSVSIDNAIITRNCTRWPLMIDPQIQANKWIKNIEKSNNLRVMKFSDSNLLKNIQGAITAGLPVLIEDIEERLEPSIDPVLTKSIVETDGRKLIRVGDTSVDWSPDFRLYFTTKIPNPHYLPEVCIKVTVINFTVTFEGLKDQLLGDVVKQERPDVEKQRDEIVVGISSLNRSLKELQDRILELLANSKGLILDDLDLISALEDSKIKSFEISKNLAESAEVEKVINETREAYLPVAVRGTILYFVISDLANIDPMYQYSLTYFKRLFNIAIEQSEKSDVLETRLEILINIITKNVYVNICRGLFEAHKKIFSFLICTSIERNRGNILESDWNLFLRGFPQTIKADLNMPNPDPKTFTEYCWNFLQYLNLTHKTFEGLSNDITSNLAKWESFLYAEEPFWEVLPGYEQLTPFQKLLLLKAAKPESILVGMIHYVSQQMGKFYEESAAPTLEEVYADSDFKTPVIFILSQGADPSTSLVKFSQEKGYYERKFVIISLGQGQGKKAEFHIEHARAEGGWVLLQNCHLAKSWMPSLEKLVETFGTEESAQNTDFRLFLTSMPADYFPVSVLQNGVKMTTEAPRGLKANLKRSYQGFTQKYLDESDKPINWRKLLFGLSFFHAIVQERRKFGPLGFNKKYEFNDSDLDVSCMTLKMFLDGQNEEIPWDALLYVTGQINYGGRVTDDWDRRCLLSILRKYISLDVLADDYVFSDSGIYYVPKDGPLEDYRSYIEKQLPNNDNPEVFGLHDNANIVYMTHESNKIIESIMIVQPRVAGSSEEKSTDDQVLDIAKELLLNLPVNLGKENGNKKLFEANAQGLLPSLSTVLLQEMERFNKLLDVMRITLAQLQSAIKGLIIMSGELDQMYKAFLANQLPANWKAVSYDSLKALASWYADLLERVRFMEKWLMGENPTCYWLSGFFFPHGFITGVLQTHARRYKIPIDKLSFKFKVLNNQQFEKISNPPKDGVYINGLFLDGARWDEGQDTLADQYPGELTNKMPIIHFIPVENYVPNENDYSCPIYKTSVRIGVLSTTGQSTNFILAVDLQSKNERPEFWTLRGAALLCQLDI